MAADSTSLDNMTSPNPRPNMMYVWEGFPVSRERGLALLSRDHEEVTRRSYLVRALGGLDPGRQSGLKRYLSEMPWWSDGNDLTDIFPINSQAQERLDIRHRSHGTSGTNCYTSSESRRCCS